MREYAKYTSVSKRGTIIRIDYRTLDENRRYIRKYANVYLPYGYEKDKERKYNILYVIHGGGGNADAWLDSCLTKNMLDYSFEEDKVNPFIVVFPGFYKEDKKRTGPVDPPAERAHVLLFQDELVSDLIPAVESQVRSYADGYITPDTLIATREHRAITGFSMGGVTTWFAFLKHMDHFATFLPLSGDCWEVEPRGGFSKPEETAKAVYDAVQQFGYTSKDFRILAATGDKDIAFDALDAQIQAMRQYSDVFTEENLQYLLAPDMYHTYEAVCTYLYNLIPDIFV